MSAKDAGSGNINVVCRVRPFNKSELEMGSVPCVDFLDQQSIRLKLTSTDGKEKTENKQVFNFDRVFSLNTTQQQIYEFAAKPVVLSVLEGFNGTVFAYGQTSSGKTFTMQGVSIEDEQLKGVIPRMVKTVFEHIADAPEHIEFRIKISIVEIYMEKIRDLLDNTKQNLVVREDKQRGVYIQDVTEQYVSTEQEVFDLMRIGNQNRAVTATNMNEGSSRYQSILFSN